MKIAVVGGCGSGKSTIVNELKARGYDAWVVGQEHSEVRGLWSRRNPDVLVFLDVTLEAVRRRRDENWPEWLYHRQQARLTDARESASIHLNTAALTVEETVAQLLDQLDDQMPPQDSSLGRDPSSRMRES